MGIINQGIKVFNQLRNDEDFTANTGDFTTTVKANIEEVIKIQSTFRLEWEVLSSPTLNGNQFIVTDLGGGTKAIQSTGLNFNEFRINDEFTLDDFGGPVTYTLAVATLVSGSYMEFNNTASAIPDGVYTDALVFGTTDLDTLDYKFNFPAASDSSNLISDVFGLIPEFSFSGMAIVGPDVIGKVRSPFFWNGGSAVARRLATVNGNQFVYQVDLIVFIPHYTESEFTNLITQQRTDVFQVETQFFAQRASFQKGSDAETNRTFDLSRPVNDSIGWFNENFDGGDRQYSAVSVDLTELTTGDEREVLEVTETTVVSFVIAANGTTFTTLDPLQAKFSYLPPDQTVQESGDDLNDTYLYEGLRTGIDDPNTSGVIIQELDVNLDNATQISGSFRITFTADQQAKIISNGGYVISFLMAKPQSDQETVNRLNLILQVENFTKNTDIAGLVAMNTDDVYYLPDVFNLGVTEGFTDLIEWNSAVIMRDIEFDLEVEIDQLVTIKGLRVIVGAYNSTTDDFFPIDTIVIPTVLLGERLETGNYRVPLYDVDDKRGFRLVEGSIFDLLRLTLGSFSAGTQTFTLQVGQMIPWQYWQQLPEANTAFFDTGEPNNGLNLLTSRYSGSNGYDIRLVTELDIRKNNGLENVITPYQFLSEPGSVHDFGTNSPFTKTIEYFDENDDLLVKVSGLGYLPQDGITKVVVTWDDGITKTNPGSFDAEVRLELSQQGTQKSKQIINSVDGVLDGEILTPLEGETLLFKEIVAGKYTASCLIDGSRGLLSRYSIEEELHELFARQSILFPGIDEAITIANDPSINFAHTSPFSFAGWVKKVSNGVIDRMFNSFDGTRGIGMGIATTNEAFFVLDDTAVGGIIRVFTTNKILVSSGWTFVAGTYDGSNDVSGMKMYIDGSVETPSSTNNTPLTTLTTANTTNIAANGGLTAFSNYFMSNFSIWKKELTALEVTEAYAIGCPPDLNSHSASADLVCWLEVDTDDTTTLINDKSSTGNDGTGINLVGGDFTTDLPC